MKSIVALAVAALLTACGEAELGSGYRYVKLDGYAAAILDRNNTMVVDPHVKRYAVIDGYIVGKRADADIDDSLSKRYGYFILNMQSGELLEGLGRSEFEAALNARNLSYVVWPAL